MQRRQPRLIVEWLAAGAIASLVVVALALSGAAVRLDNLLYDAALRAASRPAPDSIVIAAIDEESLKQLGPWPWPRRIHAAVIDRLAAAKPQSILYDVLFSEPGGDDAALAAAVARVAARAQAEPLVMPVLLRVPGRDGRPYDVAPPVVAGPATRLGHAEIRPDPDGVVRRLDLALDGLQRLSEVAVLATEATPDLPAFAARPGQPLLRTGTRLIGFGGPPGRFRTVPLVAVLRGEVPVAFLTGKHVLVGATAAGLGDQYSVPTGGDTGVMPGVEIQANLMADLLEGRAWREAPRWQAALAGIAALWLLLWALLRLTPARAALAGVALMLAVLGGSLLLLHGTGLWLPPAAALIGLALVQPLWAWRRLAAVNGWMTGELAALARAPGLLPAAAAPVEAADPVTRQTALLGTTIDRIEDLRQLATTALHSLPDATVLAALDGGIADANPAAAALFGADPGPAAIDAAFAGSGLPPFGPAALADPAAPWTAEAVATDGSIREIRHAAWTGADGLPRGWIVRFADVTALRRAEQAREEALQLLTHDMRAPQASILALVAQHGAAFPADSAVRLRHLASRTVELADGYLHLARADAGGYPVEPLDLADIAIEAADELWPQSKAAGVTVRSEGSLVFAQGNRALLIRAAINLIGNAIKFGAKTVTCRTSAQAGQAVLEIADDGPGMPPETVARLFQRFRHMPHDAGSRSDGIGLGLAFVQSVAAGHGGSVMCRSAPGEGAVFTVRLPLVD